MTTHLPILTHSSAKAFRRCARLYRHRYVDLMRPVADEAHPLRFGSLMHRGLEAWWQGSRMFACEDADPYDLATAQVLLEGYAARWGREPLTTVAVEREFRADLLNPETGAASRTYRLGGKADVIVQDLHGDYWLVEHKTSSEDVTLGSPYWQRLQMDPQVSLYLDAIGEQMGIRIAGCLYDVIKKPTIRPAKATPEDKRRYTKDGRLYAKQRAVDESPAEWAARLRQDVIERPDFYFVRGEIARTERDLEDARADLWQTAKALRDAERLSRWPRNPDACWAYNRACNYWEVCTGQASLSDPRKFEKTEKHTELTTEDEVDAAE